MRPFSTGPGRDPPDQPIQQQPANDWKLQGDIRAMGRTLKGSKALVTFSFLLTKGPLKGSEASVTSFRYREGHIGKRRFGAHRNVCGPRRHPASWGPGPASISPWYKGSSANLGRDLQVSNIRAVRKRAVTPPPRAVRRAITPPQYYPNKLHWLPEEKVGKLTHKGSTSFQKNKGYKQAEPPTKFWAK